MTRSEFYKRLAKCAKKYRFDLCPGGSIRSKKRVIMGRTTGTVKTCFCPITAVAKEITGHDYLLSEYTAAADAIKLKGAGAIVAAADREEHYTIRTKLLKACGLKS